MALNTEIPVFHIKNKKLGRGIMIGDFPIVTPREDGSGVDQTILMKVIWENVTSPCPSFHSPEELAHAVDFDEAFGEDEEEEEEEEEEENNFAEDEEEIEELEVLPPEDHDDQTVVV